MIRKDFFKEFSIKLSPGVLTVFLIIIQSCGVNFFEKQGAILVFVILLLSKEGFKFLKKSDIRNLGLIFAFLTASKMVNPSFEIPIYLFQMGLVLESYIFLLSYKEKGMDQLKDDFYGALNIIFVQAVIGYILYLIIPFAFVKAEKGYPYISLLYFFFVSGEYAGLARNNGLVWEPGLLQLMLNMLLFYSIKRDRSNTFLLILTITIISTFSTSGYFCLALNYILYVFYNFRTRKRFVVTLLVLTALSSSVLLFMWQNISDKLSGDNLSGLARYRDLYIGFELIKEKPFFGHGVYDVTYLYSKPYVTKIEVALFGGDIIDIIGTVSGGYVNGFLGVFTWFGIPASLALYFLFFKNKLVDGKLYQRILFFTMMCFTFFAEPITYTSFFLIFPFSTFIYWYETKEEELTQSEDEQDIDNYSYV